MFLLTNTEENMRKLSVVIAERHSTSICLEEEFLAELKKIAANKKMSLNQLVTQIDAERKTENLSSAIRIYILNFIKNN